MQHDESKVDLAGVSGNFLLTAILFMSTLLADSQVRHTPTSIINYTGISSMSYSA